MSSNNISQKICSYEKYGFCMKREKCDDFHPTENCIDGNCSIVNCRRRHPQQCRFFGTQKGCRFGSSCKFDHQRQMCLQNELQEMKSKQEKLIHEMTLRDDTIKQMQEKIELLEKNLSNSKKDTSVSDDNGTMTNLSKKTKISISYPHDNDQNIIRDVQEKVSHSSDKTSEKTDVEMTDINDQKDVIKQFCDTAIFI